MARYFKVVEIDRDSFTEATGEDLNCCQLPTVCNGIGYVAVDDTEEDEITVPLDISEENCWGLLMMFLTVGLMKKTASWMSDEFCLANIFISRAETAETTLGTVITAIMIYGIIRCRHLMRADIERSLEWEKPMN